MNLRRFRPAAVLLLALHLNACVTWQPTNSSPREFIERERPGTIRVTTVDGTTLIAREPRIKGDSITVSELSATEECREMAGLPDEVCVRDVTQAAIASLDEVASVEVREVQTERTIWLAIGLVFGIGMIAWATGDNTVTPSGTLGGCGYLFCGGDG